MGKTFKDKREKYRKPQKPWEKRKERGQRPSNPDLRGRPTPSTEEPINSGEYEIFDTFEA